MDWSSMFDARVVVFGCGNTLFGDDGLAPRTVQALAQDPSVPHGTALIDAGTSIRPLLMDLSLSEARPERVVLIDVVMEEGREPGSIRCEDIDNAELTDPAGGFMHQAPTMGLLRRMRDSVGTDIVVLTVQAARIPEEMDDSLSPEASAALPRLVTYVKELCNLRSDA